MKIKPLVPAPAPLKVQTAAQKTLETLGKASAQAPTAGLAEFLAAYREDEDLTRADMAQAATLAVASLDEPKEVIAAIVDVIATATKKTPADIRAQIAEALTALAEKPTVTTEQLDAALAAPPEKRLQVPSNDAARVALPFGQLKDISPDEYVKLRKAVAAEMLERWGDAALNEPLVNYFIQRFSELTGVNVVRAGSKTSGAVGSFFRDFGDAFRDLFERMPITVLGSSAGDEPDYVKTLMTTMYQDLKTREMSEQVEHVGRFSEGGLQSAAFSVAERIKNVDRIGLSAATRSVLTQPAAPLTKGVLFGNNAGDETWLTRELARRGVALVFGGDAQSVAEARDAIARKPGRVIVLGGPALPAELAAELSKAPGVLYIPDAATRPVEAGQKIAAKIAELVTTDTRDLYKDPLLHLAFKASTGQLADAVNHLEQISAQNRIVRVITAVGNRLERSGMPSADLYAKIAELSQELSRYTLGVDNFKDNALWQKRAREAFSVAGLEEMVNDFSTDIYFASWTGIQKQAEKPSYFEEKVGELPPEARRSAFDYKAPHTMLDVDKYRYVRLDEPIAEMLKTAVAGDVATRPEVFLGTEEELRLFYEAKGFSTSFNTFDSNGTHYFMFQRGDIIKPVIFGADSPARLTQITALMEQAGVDTSKIQVRGEMDRVMLGSQNALEMELRAIALQTPIAGAVINTSSNVVAALAKQAGVSPDDIKVTTRSVGPFKFDAIEVFPVGSTQPQVVLAFKPAYGELSQSLTNALLPVMPEKKNLMIGGAGGSLVNLDSEFGALHRVTQIDFKGQKVDLAQAGLKLMGPVKGVTQDDVTNIFHPSPMLQGQAWAEQMRGRYPKSDVDQETAAVLFALTEAKRKKGPGETTPRGGVSLPASADIFVSTLLHQSDVVGKGYLELGTVDKKFDPDVLNIATKWFSELGVGAVQTKTGVAEIKGAKAGRLAATEATFDISKVDLPKRDLSSIGTSSEYSHIDQFKGQKRVLLIETDHPTATDKQRLNDMLSRLDPTQHWVVFSQTDPLHGELSELAHRRGFETLLLTTRQAAMDDQILGRPDFTMFFDKPEEIASAKTELTTTGTRYEWEENDAQHARIVVGEAKLTQTPKPFEFYTQLMTRPQDAVRAGAQIRAEVDARHTQLEDGVDGWYRGTYSAKEGETVLGLAARFGLVDLRAGLTAAVLPAARELAAAALGSSAGLSTLNAKELRERLKGVDSPLAKLATAALVAGNSWPENIGPEAKLAALDAAVDGLMRQSSGLGPEAGTPAVAALQAALKNVKSSGLSNPLGELNPTLKNGEALHDGDSVKLRSSPERSAPKQMSLETLKEELAGRKLLYVTGASAKSWPLMSIEDRARQVKMFDLLSKVLDPKKVALMTGGATAFGDEKWAQQMFHDRGFMVIAPETENTLKDMKDISLNLTHTFVGGINWFGKSRPVLKMVEELGGEVLGTGGGAILYDELFAALAMGLRTHLLDGIKLSEAGTAEQTRLEGKHAPVRVIASTELASEYKANAFTGARALLERLGIDPNTIDPSMLSDDLPPEVLREVIDVNREAAAFARYNLSVA